MLDITYDSFVVNDYGHVILSDLQNVLVVDQQAVKSGKFSFFSDSVLSNPRVVLGVAIEPLNPSWRTVAID